MHAEAWQWVKWCAWSVPPIRSVAEFGSRIVNGSVREIFTAAEVYVGIDRMPGRGVDIVVGAAEFKPPQSFDCVVCCEVLEHAFNASHICHNAWAILAHGGLFIATAAGPGREPHDIDGGKLRAGQFYHAPTQDELRTWLSDFSFVLVDGHSRDEDVYALAFKS